MQITTIRRGFKESHSLDTELMPNAGMLLPLAGFRYSFWASSTLLGQMESSDGLYWTVTNEKGNKSRSYFSQDSAISQLNNFMQDADALEVHTADLKSDLIVSLVFKVLVFNKPYRLYSELDPDKNHQVQICFQHKNKTHHFITLYHD